MPPTPASNGFKVALVGDSKVGKSTILSILLGDSFSPLYVQTKEKVIKFKDVNVQGSKRSKRLQIWDTAGADDFRTIAAYEIQDVQGIIIVLDVCEEDSYMHVQNWFKLISNILGDMESTVIVLAANKIDKVKTRKVKKEQVEQLAHQFNVKHMEVSAKSGDNIHELFKLVAGELHQKAVQQSEYKKNADESVDEAELETEKTLFDKLCVIL